jgi:hypothetical protein
VYVATHISNNQFLDPGSFCEVCMLREGNGTFGGTYMLMCSVENEPNSYLKRAHPVMAYVWGQSLNGSLQHIASLTCAATAEVVNTWTRFRLPDFDIPDDHPPVPDESSATLAVNQFVPVSSLVSSNNDGSISVTLDSFFLHLTTGRYAIPEESLRNVHDVDKVVKAIKFQSNIMTAQEFDITRTTNTSRDVTYTGEVTVPNQLRLIQDAVSTRVLEALLAAILILGISGSVLMNTDHILPKNPSRIAAVASLLAESNFLGWFRTIGSDPNDISVGCKFFSQYRFFIGRPSDSSDQNLSSLKDNRNIDDCTIYLGGPVKEKCWNDKFRRKTWLDLTVQLRSLSVRISSLRV